MNLPNKLTILRVCMVPFFVLFMYMTKETNWAKYIALLIFVVASLTDLIDGKIARKYNLVTDFGKFADPLADKILTLAAFVMLVASGTVAAWMVITILAREYAVTGLRIIAAGKGITIAASGGGKLKTTLQMVAIILAILLGKCPLNDILMFIVTIVTIWSGVEYYMAAKGVISFK